jgi:hypothetical protein
MDIALRKVNSEAGMTTAEYAVGTCGAIGLGGLILKIVTDPSFIEMLKQLLFAIFKLILPG